MDDESKPALDAEALLARAAAAELRAAELEARVSNLEKANASLEQELRPFHVLADNIPDHVFFKDRDFRFIWVNRNMLRTRGLKRRDELIGKTSFDIHPGERAMQASEDDRHILATGEYLLNKLETDAYADGSLMWVLTTKVPLRDAQGAIIGIVGISKDVTKQILAEDALVRDSALRNDLLENIPDAVYFKDRDSRFTWVNKTLLAILGKSSKAEVVGKTDADFFSPEYAEAARQDELRIMATGSPMINKTEADSKTEWFSKTVLTTKIALHDGKGEVVGTCGITRDITALKKAEDALAHESSLLKALMDNIPDAIYFKDMESRFLRVSRNCHLEGMRRPEDAIGKTDFDFFAEEHARDSYNDEQEIIRTGVPILDKVEKETFTNRAASWVSTTKVPILDIHGRPAGIVGISRDVTERMLAVEAVRKAKDELEIRVQERTSALVQEIKEHLRTEKALREGERKLQIANQRLESRVNQLNFLNSAAHRMAHFAHRRDLIPAILEIFTQAFGGMEASLCEMEETGYACVASTQGLRGDEARQACAMALAGRGLSPLTGPVVVSDRRQDSALGGIHWPGMDAQVVYVALPLMMEDKSLAVVQLLAGPDFLSLYEQEKLVLNTLATHAAVSLSNANNFHELEKKARLAGELEVAQSIQRRFTPQHKPSIPRLNLKGAYFPAYEVGGDYLDYFQTDSGNWVVVIADVSGKGIPAALVMTMLRSTFRAEARYESSAKQLMCAVNETMIADLDSKSFVTALCLIIDKDGRAMSYARAGHPPLLLQQGVNRSNGIRGARGGRPVPMNPKGLALGLVGGAQFSERLEEMTLELNPGDRYLVFTDGVLEAMDPDRKTYGMNRLVNMLESDSQMDPDRVVAAILDDVKLFMRNEPYHDDLTMLAMEVTG